MANPKYGRSARLRSLPTPRDHQIFEALRTHTRLTREQIRRLFFRHRNGGLTSVQAVNARLQKLVQHQFLEPLVVNGGRGAGPYAYGLGKSAKDLIRAVSRHGSLGPVRHYLEIAEFRVRLQEALEGGGGEVVEWLGETQLRSLVRQRCWPVPDALVHWRLEAWEGTFLLEWDRGSESLAVLTAKIARYGAYWRSRGHRQLVPGLGLRPRLAIVVPAVERAQRLIAWFESRPRQSFSGTLLIGLRDGVLAAPLGESWWRSDRSGIGRLQD